ncbi:uncharacterized protein LOC127092955 [Lathyrus oleraceus]|uniref:uncharacterized protein LOC127092955 n=1 Tax=Pisum sativum TaxID=3888 RepID=UPI0021D2B3C4|nr:uncharacterized protein LOC127092955 [Pisum sativum]
MTAELEILTRISAYLAENKRKLILERQRLRPQNPIYKETALAFVGENKLLKKVHLESKWQNKGRMLAQEDCNGVKKPIYYLSRMLVDVETRYSLIEKLCMCLYFACMKLKQYIKPVDVYVLSHYDIIKHMLSKPILHSRIGKWELALTKFSLTFKPLKAMKGQIMADFIVDHAMIESSLNVVDTTPWRLYFDGSSHKDGTGVGVLILSPQVGQTEFKYRISEKCSTNEAEYEALIVCLQLLKGMGASRIEVRGDSELIIKKVTHEYKCIKGSLLKYFVTATQLLEHFEVADIRHVPRSENQEANELAQVASGYKMSKSSLQDMIEVRGKMVSSTTPTEDVLDENVSRDGDLDEECQEICGVEEAWEHGVFTINNSTSSD